MALLDSLLDVKGIVGKIVDTVSKHIPTPETELKKMELENALTSTILTQLASVDVAINQVNLEEAKGGWFKSGWRPFLGWTCGCSVSLHSVIFPLCTAWVPGFVKPTMDMELVITLLGGLLGLGTMRTVEKLKKVT